MNSRTRSRSPASMGSNQSSRRWTADAASDCRGDDVVLLLVMAQSPPACANAGIVWVSAPGDYAILNSNHTPDGTTRIPAKYPGHTGVTSIVVSLSGMDLKHISRRAEAALPLKCAAPL